jgi:hypothetical protein
LVKNASSCYDYNSIFLVIDGIPLRRRRKTLAGGANFF